VTWEGGRKALARCRMTGKKFSFGVLGMGIGDRQKGGLKGKKNRWTLSSKKLAGRTTQANITSDKDKRGVKGTKEQGVQKDQVSRAKNRGATAQEKESRRWKLEKKKKSQRAGGEPRPYHSSMGQTDGVGEKAKNYQRRSNRSRPERPGPGRKWTGQRVGRITETNRTELPLHDGFDRGAKERGKT